MTQTFTGNNLHFNMSDDEMIPVNKAREILKIHSVENANMIAANTLNGFADIIEEQWKKATGSPEAVRVAHETVASVANLARGIAKNIEDNGLPGLVRGLNELGE